MASRSTPVNGVGYDKSLLADAPEITKLDKQEGYNPDLLEQGRPTPRPGTVPPPSGTRSPALVPGNKYGGGGGGSDESSGVRKGGLPVTTHTGSKPKRSKKLMIAIAAVVLLIVIGVAVGVGVGVSKSRHNNNAAAPPNGTESGGTNTGKPTDAPTATATTDSGKPPIGTGTTSDEGGGAVGTSNGLVVPTSNGFVLPTTDSGSGGK